MAGEERDLTSDRPTEWKAWVTALAVAALIFQAALSSLTPPQVLGAAAIDRLAAYVLCIGSGRQPSEPNGPVPVHDRTHQGCCILCNIPALDAYAANPGVVQTPAWGPSLAAPLGGPESNDPTLPSERSPIRARAPPSA